MKTRFVPLVGLAISFALPTYAQQKDVPDPRTTQKLLALAKANAEAKNNRDAAAIAACYTRDAVFVTASAFRDRIQDVHSKTSSRLVCWIG